MPLPSFPNKPNTDAFFALSRCSLGHTYEECRQQGGENLDIPATPSSSFVEELERTEKALLEQSNEDKRGTKQR